LRDLIKKEHIRACLIVAQRSTLLYPQKWRAKTVEQWPFGDTDGLFVELECSHNGKPFRFVHFVPIDSASGRLQATLFGAGEGGSGKDNDDAAAALLDADMFALFPALFSDKLEVKFV
jgi:hypothetical protein